jgi:hypothetical protein
MELFFNSSVKNKSWMFTDLFLCVFSLFESENRKFFTRQYGCVTDNSV